jgi:diguanylate cyclase (GGDEF)-like protein
VSPPVAAVLIAAALALLPLALATFAFGRAFRASEVGRADARLATATGIAVDRVATAASRASSAARSLASSPTVRIALAEHDDAALARAGYRSGALTVTAAAAGGTAAAPRGTLVRTVLVVDAGRTIGRVDAVLDVAPLVAAVAAATHVDLALADTAVRTGPLRGWRPAGTVGSADEITFHGRGYRVLRTPLGHGSALVALVSDGSIDAGVRHRQLLVLAAGALMLAALALAALLLLQRRMRRGQRRHRSPLALVGDVAAAAHDPRALLPVLLETAVVALEAAGGFVVWDGERIAAIAPEATTGLPLALALDDEADGPRQIVLYPRHGGFSRADREVASSLVAQGRIALENARLHSVVRRQAVTDELTDLSNRRRFMEVLHLEVARAVRFGSPLALVLLDLDHFKQINDRFGHQAGDDVLRSAAAAIRGRVRETDLPARIGGEEFAVILTGTGEEGALELAEQLRVDLSRGVRVPGVADWTVTASFGVAVLHQGGDTELLIGAADRALYQAKADGRNVVRAAAAAETSSAA